MFLLLKLWNVPHPKGEEGRGLPECARPLGEGGGHPTLRTLSLGIEGVGGTPHLGPWTKLFTKAYMYVYFCYRYPLYGLDLLFLMLCKKTRGKHV